MICEFENKYAFLSNFYASPFTHDGIAYPTVEHFFQAAKTLNIAEKKAIAAADTPGKAKRMGRAVKLRPDWEKVKVYYMELGLRLKFADPELAQKLIATGDEELIEGNWWHDNTWGSCFCSDCINKPGRNLLGMLLMELRKELIYGNSSNEVAHF
jgi:ribA/ribD-fused uncharacterized protein